MILSSSAYAAGLGKLTVLSSLGQPLNAEIELTAVAADEANGLVAKLAPADAYRAANIEFNPALLSLRFNVEQRGGRQIIKITSSQPVNEPFVDMLLELSWGSGRLVREYTFLLDPAEMRATQSAQVAAPVDVLSQGSRPGAAARPAPRAATPSAAEPARTAAAPAPRTPEAGETREGASQYRTKPGDTLGKIAGQLRPVDISLDMMLVALYRANPDAFTGNNMNRLKSGQILTVPDSDSIKSTGQGEARGVVVAHAADFNAYRNKLAGQVSAAAPAKAPESAQSATGKITAKVEERPTATSEAKDQLKLSKATPDAKGGLSAEDRIAKDKALAEAAARVKELERNVSELEKLVTIKNKAGSEAQKAPVVETPAKVAPPAPAPAPVAAAPAPAPAPVVEAPKPAAEAPKPGAIKPIIKKTAPPAPEEPSFADMVMDNIMYVLGGLAVLVLALVGVAAARRRKANGDAPIEPSVLGAPTDQAHSLFAETGGQSIDTNNSVFNSSFAPSASQLDTNEVDPVAEADVYIAYGRDAQAEEILKEALRTHPERYPVRLKLLEIYAARKDQRAFESQASELYGMTKGQGDEWAQAALLGLSIDPQNPLYASAAAATIAVPATQMMGEQTILNQQLDDALADDNGPHSALMDLDLDLNNDATVVAAPAPAPAPAPKDDANSLDFDLGGLSFEPAAQSTDPLDMPSSQSSPNVPDLDFGSPAAAPAPIALDKKPADDLDMGFDMDFNAPTAAPSAPAKPLDIDADRNDLIEDFGTVDLSKEFAGNNTQADAAPALDLGDMNFDLPSSPAPSAAPAAPAANDLASQEFFDVPDLPLPETPKASAPAFDMSGIDLDLPPGAADSASHDFADIGRIPEAGGEAANSAVHMEMETKLDLAIAYQEIGDKEGARELLDEVIKGGSGEQVSKANEMRAKLA